MSFGQNFLINEGFTGVKDTTPPAGWQNVTLSGNYTVDKFFFDNDIFHLAPPVQGAFAIMDSYNGGSPGGTASNGLGEDVVLQLPDVSTTGLNNLSISFSKQTFVQSGASISLQFSTDTGQTWFTVWSQSNNVVDGSPVNVELNIDSLKGYPVLQTRFHWVNVSTLTYRGFFALDNVALFERKNDDVRPTALVRMYDKTCPEARQPIEVEITNAGLTNVVNIPVRVISGSYSSLDTIASLASGSSVTIVMPDSLNTSGGGTFDFRIFTALAGDQVVANDTLEVSRVCAKPPATPGTFDVERCGTGTVMLSATRNTADSTFWFNDPKGGKHFAAGTPVESPVISTTTVFYCENSTINENEISSFAGLYRFNATTSGPGSMFNVEAKNDVIIDSLGQHFAYSGTYDMRVFVKDGTYRGSETTSTDWTEVDLIGDTLVVDGYGRFYAFRLKDPIRIPAGNTTAFYVDADISSITFTNGAMNFENSDLTLEGNTVLSNDFANALTGYYWNGKIFYRKTCSSDRVGLTATVLSTPVGASLQEGDVFEGEFRVGNLRDPDIAAEGKKLVYEIDPPTGYTNADHGSTWSISEITLETVNGVPVPSGDTVISMPDTANGTITFTTTQGWADSLLLMRVVINKSSNNCDSTLMRYIYIAATPVINIDFSHVCDGDFVSFVNRSEVLNGFLTYHWDFGDGGQSTSAEPIYTYSAFGTYQVTLTVTSDNNITVDTTFNVFVYEIPDVDFVVESSCEGVPARFINNTTIGTGTLSYHWDFGDGDTSLVKDPTHQYTTVGSYKVTLRAFANGCSNKLSNNANLFARPEADFEVQGACSGTPIRFTNTSTIKSEDPIGSFWRFGDGTVGTLTDIEHTYDKGAVYDVEMVAVTRFGCRDSIIKQVTIRPSPTAEFSFGKACEVSPVEFNNETTVPQGLNVIYIWDFGDGDSSTISNPEHQYGARGKYKVTLTATGVNGCESSIEKELYVSAQPNASFEVTNGCSGKPIQFVNTTTYSEGSITYKWFFGDLDSSDFTSPVHVYNVNSTITFNVTLQANIDGGCIDEATKAVTIEETPDCDFTAEMSDSNRMIWTFYPVNQSYDPSFYSWVFEGSGAVAGEITPTYRFEYPETRYRVILRIKTENGCECLDSTNFITTSWNLGAEGPDQQDIAVYPNPAEKELFVRLSEGADTGSPEVNITDHAGRLVWSGRPVSSGMGAYRINVDGYAAGFYFVKVVTEKNHTVYKVMIHGQ